MKPQSIKLFDYFYLGAIFLGVLSFISGYEATKAQLAAESAASGVSVSPMVAVVGYAIAVGIGLLLWYLVSKQRSTIAKWIIVIFFLISLASVGSYLAGPMPLSEIYGLLSLLCHAVAVSLLFRGDAIRWLEDREEAEEHEDAPADPN